MLDHFGHIDTPGARIYASFLGRVAVELGTLLGSQSAARDLHVMTYTPELDIDRPSRPADRLHRDNFVTDAEIGIRYLVANRLPTVIPELIRTRPGVIYRTANNYTLHKRPKYKTDWSAPRALLVVNA